MSAERKHVSRDRDVVPPRIGEAVSDIAAGLVVALIAIPLPISYAALIFTGALAGYVSSGVGLALFGGLVGGLVVAFTSSYQGSVFMPQSGPAAILALAAVSITSGLAGEATSHEAFLTVVVAIALASAITGFVFLALGTAKLGTLVKYIPYPVVGGFLGGTGWLLVRGAFGVMTDIPLSFAQLPVLFQAELLVRWLPPLGFAVLLVVLLRRTSHALLLPGMLVVAVGTFYLVLWLAGMPVSEAEAQGWLLGPFPESSIWPPLTLSDLAGVHWSSLLEQVGNMATILVLSLVSLLLNCSALELTIRREVDLDRELRSAGLANLLAGSGGGPPGFQALILATLGHRMNARSRLVALVPAVLNGGMLFIGASVLSYFPKPVLGGVLFFVGLTFLTEWTVDAWFKLSRADYAIVLLILVVIATAGVVEGVGVGVGLTIIRFVISYSRIPVVRNTLSGRNFASNVDRPWAERRILQVRGHWLHILELQGFIFFGTANRVLESVRQRLESPGLPPPRFAVLDFRQVQGLDASAVLVFARLQQVVEGQGAGLILTNVLPAMRRQLAAEIILADGEDGCAVFPDLDHGVEWCEEQILGMAASEAAQPEVEADWIRDAAEPTASRYSELLEAVGGMNGADPGAVIPLSVGNTLLGPYLERLEPPKGYCLVRQGEASQGLYFVERGLVTAFLECEDGRELRLRKMGPGSIVGEMGLYLDQPATATVMTRQPCILYFLPVEMLRRMESEAPEVAGLLHRYIAQLLGERLSRADYTIQAVFGEGAPCPPGRQVACDEAPDDASL